MTATTLPVSTDYTGAAVTQGGKKTFVAAMRSALAEMGDPTSSFGYIQNMSLSVTGSVGALTIAVKDRAAADATSTTPITVPFRNVTAATGDYAILNITAASSLVLTSGSTLGATSGAALRVWIVGFNDGGTFRIGAVNCLSGTSIMSLMDDDIQSSTAEGGAGAADSAQVIYTGTAVTSKAMRVLGYAEWSSLTTAGTWTTPTKVQTFGPGIKLPGDLVQVVRNTTGAVATGTTVIPADDTIPQNTEGDQYLSQAITPRSGANLLEIDAVAHLSGASTASVAALFQDSTANALKSALGYTGTGANCAAVQLRHSVLAATTSATTFKVRGGCASAGTTTFNGTSSGRLYGGVLSSYLQVTERMA